MPQSDRKGRRDDRSSKARQLVLDFVRRRSSGESINSVRLVSEHPDLACELDCELRKLEIIDRARLDAETTSSGLDSDDSPGSANSPDLPGGVGFCGVVDVDTAEPHLEVKSDTGRPAHAMVGTRRRASALDRAGRPPRDLPQGSG